MSSEEELQDVLGGAAGGQVEWIISRRREVEKHIATVYMLLGGEEGDTVVVCACDWAMRFDKTVHLMQAEKMFAEHAGG